MVCILINPKSIDVLTYLFLKAAESSVDMFKNSPR